MKILILYAGVFPGPSAGAKRIGYYKSGLEKAGISTHIIPVTPVNKKNNSRFSFYLGILATPFIASLFFLKNRKKCDVVFLYGFGGVSTLLIATMAYFAGVKIFLEINEKPGTPYGNRLTEIKAFKFISTKITEFSYRFIDGFVVISSALEDYVKPIANKDAKILKVPIIIDLERNDGSIAAPGAFTPYILHAGALSDRKDGISEVVEAFAIACKAMNRQLHFYFTSKVAPLYLTDHIQNVINKNDLHKNIHFQGDISEEQLLSYQKYCSMVIINKFKNEQNLYNFPTKLGEYLALERPVITTAIGEMGKYLKDGENAFVVPLNNVRAIADKILYVLQNPSHSAKIGTAGKKTAAEHFNYIIHGKRLADFFFNNSTVAN
jgi:glycosyltransferase involved in cell wall biosynthesis